MENAKEKANSTTKMAQAESTQAHEKMGKSTVQVHCSMQVGISRIMGNGSMKSSMEEGLFIMTIRVRTPKNSQQALISTTSVKTGPKTKVNFPTISNLGLALSISRMATNSLENSS